MKPSLFFLTTDAKILDLIRKGDEEALATLYRIESEADCCVHHAQ